MAWFHWVKYAVWLVGQVIVATAVVARDTVRIHNNHHPIVINYPLRITSDVERTIFSASITMTPATITLGFHPAEVIGEEAHSESGLILLVHSVYGQDPTEVLASIAHMEEKLNPSVAATPIEFEDWMFAGSYLDRYRRDVDFPEVDRNEIEDKLAEYSHIASAKKAHRAKYDAPEVDMRTLECYKKALAAEKSSQRSGPEE